LEKQKSLQQRQGKTQDQNSAKGPQPSEKDKDRQNPQLTTNFS